MAGNYIELLSYSFVTNTAYFTPCFCVLVGELACFTWFHMKEVLQEMGWGALIQRVSLGFQAYFFLLYHST